MQTVAQILQSKAGPLHWVHPFTTVFDALAMMARHDVGALVVLERGHVVGIFSERDYARKVILLGKSSRELPVAEIMSSPVVSVRPEHTVQACMSLMTEHCIRHLPVVEGSGLVGIVSIGDVVKAMLNEQEFVIEQLEHYITG